ncbi:RICIN domain-containing protein [Streptomyces cinerochromogenes]|uniref:RICIN domain-containing protein n=1 Tax=Streptomyces cinerochromogenes TaxID=66422 RepID=UPI0033AB416B
MQSPYPPRPPYPPLPAPRGESDRDLVARLSGPEDGHHHAVALLLARHWRPTRDYAVVCLAAAGPTAQLVATAAFHQVLGRTAGGAAGGALRPRLLVAVRDLVRAWAVDDAARIALPELRKTTGGRGLHATKPGPPESRQLAARAFRSLPGASQCLLWHAEVEAEPINIPAGLLGIDTATAATALEQAREQFRAGCVRAHRELAPTTECRFHNRLLDVPLRRGGTLLPDVRRHLTVCAHCRHAAEQLGLFDGGLPLLLAETVLGWGARRYLDSRPGRAAPEEWPAPPPSPPAASPGTGGRHRTAAEPRRRKTVALGVGLVSLAVLATVLVARSWSDDNAVPAPGATWGAPAGGTWEAPAGGGRGAPVGGGRAVPGGGTRGGPAGGATGPSGAGARSAAGNSAPSAPSVGAPVEVAHGTLRGLASRLCLDVRGDRVAAGAGVRLAPCSTALAQQWSYQDGGLLHSAADPALCLAADPRTRTVALAGCRAPAAEVSYDVTARGEILLRRHHGLALAPGSGRSGARVGVAERDGSAGQRWALEPAAVGGRPRSGTVPDGRAVPDGRMEPDGRAEPDARGGRAGAGAGRSPGHQEGTGGSRGKPGRTGQDVDGRGTAPRVAQIRAARTGRPAGGFRAAGEAEDLMAPVVGTRDKLGTLDELATRDKLGTPEPPGTLTSPVAGKATGDGGPVAAAVRGLPG